MGDVLRGCYADLKTVKTRSVCQVIIELPIEALTEVVALLGAPIPGNEVWVAIARLRNGATEPVEPLALPEPKKGTLAQQAGILCNEAAFMAYVVYQDHLETTTGVTVENCAQFVRSTCHVKSRSELDTNPEAARLFMDLRASYKAWLTL